MTYANVVDVRSGALLRDVTVAVRDGKIVSVGNDDPPAGAVVDLIAGNSRNTELTAKGCHLLAFEEPGYET